MAALGAAGFRAVAPDQRGYSPGARPEGVEPYGIAHLVGDVVAMCDALGAEQVDLVGHDWGAIVAWVVAARHPERLRTLTAVSVPHPEAFADAYESPASNQHEMSSYIDVFRADGDAGEQMLQGRRRRRHPPHLRTGGDRRPRPPPNTPPSTASRAPSPPASTGTGPPIRR